MNKKIKIFLIIGGIIFLIFFVFLFIENVFPSFFSKIGAKYEQFYIKKNNQKQFDASSTIAEGIILETKKRCNGTEANMKLIESLSPPENIYFFPWINEDEKITLINGYILKESGNTSTFECIREVAVNYLLENDFIINNKNTHEIINSLGFSYKVNESFEKNNIKVFIDMNYNYILMGNIENEIIPQEITMDDYNKVVKIFRDSEFGPVVKVSVYNVVDNFINVGVNFSVGSSGAILKKEDGWEFIMWIGSDSPNCEIILREKIPSIFIDSCWSEDGDLLEYNKENDSWEITL